MAEKFDLYQWERFLLAARLPGSTKLVAFAMRTHADPDGTRVRPGIARLAVLTDLSYATVKRARQQLVKAGLIELAKRGNRRRGGADEYRLVLAEDVLERVEWLSPSQIDAAANEITNARADAEEARRARKVQGSDTDPEPDDQGSHDAPKPADQGAPESPGQPDQGSESSPETEDQGSPESRETVIRAHTDPVLGLTGDPLPEPGTTPPNPPAPTHLPTQPQTAREKCRHGIPIGARGDGTLACAFCRREAKQQSIVEVS